MKANARVKLAGLALCIFSVFQPNAQAWVVSVAGTGDGSNTLAWVAKQINEGLGDSTITFSTSGYFGGANITSRFVTVTAEVGTHSFNSIYCAKGGDVTGVDARSIWLGGAQAQPSKVVQCRVTEKVQGLSDYSELRETVFDSANLLDVGEHTTVVGNTFGGTTKLGSSMDLFLDNTFHSLVHCGTNNVIDNGVFNNARIFFYQDTIFTNCEASGDLMFILGDEDSVGAAGNNQLSAPSGTYNIGIFYVYNNSNTVQGFTIPRSFKAQGSFNTIDDNTFLYTPSSDNPIFAGTNNTIIANAFSSEFVCVSGYGHQVISNMFSGTQVKVAATNTVIEGNEFLGSGTQLKLSGSNNTVRSSYFGMSRAGETNGCDYCCIEVRGAGNVIGGPDAQDWNLFVTDDDGIGLNLQPGAQNTLIQNNFFGVDINGTLHGCYEGIFLVDAKGVDIIGNVMASNYYGIRSADNPQYISDNITIKGNLIGTDLTGRRVITNAYSANQRAIKLTGGTNVVIGGEAVSDRNIIGNQWGLYATYFQNVDGLTVKNNYIGLGDDGSTALTNQGHGMYFGGCTDVVIGGTNAAARNVIGNTGLGRSGLYLYLGSNVTVQGNYVGLCADGLTHAPLGGYGIDSEQVRYLQIGGAGEGAGNVIGAANYNGITLTTYGYPAVCQGNIVGFGFDGVTPGNIGSDGIKAYCDYNSAGTNEFCAWIGGTEGVTTDALHEGNLIGNCGGSGLVLEGGKILGAGNWIGSDWTGTNVVGNGEHGAKVWLCKEVTFSDNLLVGNDQSGLWMYDSVASTIVSNRIGILHNDAAAGNGSNGIEIVNNSQSNIIGHVLLDDPHAIGQQRGCNIIANNVHAGILINGFNEWEPGIIGPMGNLIQGNEIKGDAFAPAIRIENVGKNGGEPLVIGGPQLVNANIILEGQVGLDLFDAHHVAVGFNRIGFNPNDTTVKAEHMAYGLRAEMCSDQSIGEEGGLDAEFAVGACSENGILVKTCTDVYTRNLRVGVIEDELAFGDYADVGNDGEGILVQSSSNVRIEDGGFPSLIANNDTGIRVEESLDVFILACQVGVMNELIEMGNLGSGISLWQTRQVQLGSALQGEISCNVIGGSEGDGIELDNCGNVGLEVNWSGIQTNGATAFPNGGNGLGIYNTTNVVIGDEVDAVNVFSGNTKYGVLLSYVTFAHAGPGNLIAASGDDGVEVWGMASHDNFIQGNQIGGSSLLGNGGHGVQLHGGDANRVGGTNAWQVNGISYNGVHGVAVFTGNQNPIRGNAIYGNHTMGIRLGTNATPYPDVTGPGYPNNHQWAPVITNATIDEAYTLVMQGRLESGVSQPYQIEYFLTPSVNISGYGEGMQILYGETITTDAEGVGLFSLEIPEAVYAETGMIVTATATDTNRNTSAFSFAQEITEPGVPPTPNPQIQLSGNLAFGHVTTNMTATRTLTIHEASGHSALTVNNITYPQGFSGPWSGTIAAGDSQNILIHFQPTAVQTYEGTITVACNAPPGNNTIHCSGRGTALAIDAEYRSKYSLPTDGSEDFIDSDGDHFTNWEEWLANTNPTNSESYFRAVQPTAGQEGFTFSWPSRAGQTYWVMISTNLLAKAPDTPYQIITGQVEQTTCTDTNNGDPFRFYWVEIPTD